ncbi:MAG: short-chain dehydrogenase/reductase [Gemmatimonadetes bacterium]|nr:short-chain dehydrogenase/reductase [Gemmatimonadota bacterium]
MDLRERWPGIHVSLVMPGIVATDFAANADPDTQPAAVSPTAASGPSPMQAQSVEDAAERIVRLVHHPAPEIYTNPTLPEVARRWFDEVNAFAPME